MDHKIAVIKLKIGNYNSISKCLKKININHIVTNDNEEINNADKVILPGVGAFGPFVQEIFDRKINIIISNKFKEKKSILGICVGYQSFFQQSEESTEVKGLSLLQGSFRKFNPSEVKNKSNLPKNHLGWNEVNQTKRNIIFDGVNKKSDFFFNHSYFLTSFSNQIVCGETNFHDNFPSVINKDNLFGVQFHPEKSQKNGLLILKNFCEKC